MINAGDDFVASITFDTTNSIIASLYDADPSINIYNFSHPLAVSLNADSYSWSESLSAGDATIQFWNDYYVSSSSPHVDSQSVTVQRNPYIDTLKSDLPYDLGLGMHTEGMSFYAFDSSGDARNSDLIDSIIPLSAFSKSFAYIAYNPDTSRFFQFQGNVTSASIVIADVPEPANWAMMVLGFGMAGAGLRRSKMERSFSTATFAS